MIHEQQKLHLAALCAILFLILMAVVSYWPGTTGGFAADDYGNLQSLQNFGGIQSKKALQYFVFNGQSGPTGRPLSLASFALDGQSWPTDAYPFKRTNILIHAINGLLVFALVLKLFQLLGRAERNGLIIAALAATLWLIHPLHTSTVLYVIQRMTELSAMFMLAGICCYLHGRQRLRLAPGPAYLWMSAGIVLFGLLALLSKENAILLPLFIVVIEFTLLRSLPRPRHWRYWAAPMLAAPIVMVLIYLAFKAIDHQAGFSVREFSLYERLLTEPRVLFDYIGKIFFPFHTPGLSFDDFVISTSLFSPLTTLPAILCLLALLVAGFSVRASHPFIAFAILWFFAGQLLESTVLPLEIYFEHRNYLPMLGPILALAYYAEKYYPSHKRIVVPVMLLIVITLAITTWNNSRLWGDDKRLTEAWVEARPDSIRSHVMNIIQLFTAGELDKAANKAAQVTKEHPQALGFSILHTSLSCLQNQLTQDEFSKLLSRASSNYIDQYVQQSLADLIRYTLGGSCRQITAEGLLRLIQALQANNVTPALDRRESALQLFKVEIYLRLGSYGLALQAIDEAFRLNPNINLALRYTQLLMRLGQPHAAMNQLNNAIVLDYMRTPLLPSRSREFERMAKEIEKQIAVKKTHK